jgi:electron transport complex protein RnfB
MAWLVGITVLLALAAFSGLIVLSNRRGVSAEEAANEALVMAIDQLLPQTQCRRCGYAGCQSYAQAIAQGEAPINRCPPGGVPTLERLARLLGRPVTPLDPACGTAPASQVAWIDEQDCIGCTRCLKVCPVDAIIGAPRWMHTVIDAQCTGCELCLPACPVDCIMLVPAADTVHDASLTGSLMPSRT